MQLLQAVSFYMNGVSMQVNYYLDFCNFNLKTQLDIIKNNKLENGFILRNINGMNFLNTPNIELDITSLSYISLGDYIFKFDNTEGYITNLINKLLLKTNKIILNINFNDTINNIEIYLKNIKNLFPNAIIFLNPINSFNGVIIKEVLSRNKLKNIHLYFGLKEVFKQNISYLAQYRMLKPFIKMISFTDYDDKEVPNLLGYGRFELLNFFKILLEDHYDGAIALDSDIFNIIKLFDKEHSKFKDKFTKFKYKKNYFNFKKLISNNGNLSINDAFINQLNVLKKIFNIL